MKAKTFDRKFDSNEDVLRHVDISRASRPNATPRRVNVDFPEWMVQALDREARHLGVSRQAVIKVWVAERLEQASAKG